MSRKTKAHIVAMSGDDGYRQLAKEAGVPVGGRTCLACPNPNCRGRLRTVRDRNRHDTMLMKCQRCKTKVRRDHLGIE